MGRYLSYSGIGEIFQTVVKKGEGHGLKLPNVPIDKLGGYYISIYFNYSIRPIINKNPIAEAPIPKKQYFIYVEKKKRILGLAVAKAIAALVAD